jgi:membrane associated rhomboid family serine protease
MPEPESKTPVIAIAFYVVGFLSLVIGVLSLSDAAHDDAATAQSDVVAAVGGIVGGFLFIALGYGLKKLCQIELHLRFRNKIDAAEK